MELINLTKFGYFGLLAHGPVLENKVNANPDDLQLKSVFDEYKKFIDCVLKISFDRSSLESTKGAISELTKLLNIYRNFAFPILEARENSGQENLRSSLLEEFFQILLFPLTNKIRTQFPEALTLGKANSYVSLTFTPKSFEGLFENPTPHLHTKDQDFVLGCTVNLYSQAKSSSGKSASVKLSEVVVPVVAIECKTYIERNMLDSCAGTAHRLKAAMPYCLYVVAAEYMKMEDAYPELTDIDELFILTRAANSERLRAKAQGMPLHQLCDDLFHDIYLMVSNHLSKIWWAPEDALKRGRVISRP